MIKEMRQTIYQDKNFTLTIKVPYHTFAACNQGFYLDDAGHNYQQHIYKPYKHFYDPITLQLLSSDQGICPPITSNIYGINPITGEKKLVYDINKK